MHKNVARPSEHNVLELYVYIDQSILMHVPCIFLLVSFQPTNTQIYITTLYLYIMFTLTCFDISVSSSGSFKNFVLR